MNAQATAIGISTRSNMYRALLVLLGLFTLFGISFYILEIRSGASPTSWGMLTTNFLFLMSISHFGVCFVAVMRICKAQWAKPFYRLGELVTLAFAPIAFVLLVSIYVFAREDIFYWITAEDIHNPWLNETWLLYRNILGLAAFYGLTLWYFIVGLLPDLDTDMAERVSGWRKGLYRWLLSLKAGKDDARLKERAYKLSLRMGRAAGTAAQPGCYCARERRHGEMHFLHPAHPRREGSRKRRRPAKGTRRRSNAGLRAGLPDRGTGFW